MFQVRLTAVPIYLCAEHRAKHLILMLEHLLVRRIVCLLALTLTLALFISRSLSLTHTHTLSLAPWLLPTETARTSVRAHNLHSLQDPLGGRITCMALTTSALSAQDENTRPYCRMVVYLYTRDCAPSSRKADNLHSLEHLGLLLEHLLVHLELVISGYLI